jgi:peptidyl-prolyl cis-trans isomerase C
MSSPLPITSPLLAAAVIVLLSVPASAADLSDAVLAKSPETVLTRGDWEADLQRIPADRRAAFASGPQRVQAVINNLLVSKTLAARARAQGMQRDPFVARRIEIETDRLLAAQMIDRIESDARADFDRNMERNLARARELYLASGRKYATTEEIDVSHILFSSEKRGREMALAAAQATRMKLMTGADFAVLANELSDDPSAKANGGRLSWFARGAMDPAFEKVAFGLQTVGELSEPVLSSFGYHVIRLEGRKPSRQPSFDDVKAKIIDEMRTNYANEKRDSVIAGIRSDPRLQVNQEAIDALVLKGEVPAAGITVLPSPPGTDPAPK